ncbi:MAG: Crp/Fnr family transcriptional regulator [Spirosomaceae bacterium]|nr:Crp/Fnr family transcriptional regulator [Spirosomataceae bacterium]
MEFQHAIDKAKNIIKASSVIIATLVTKGKLRRFTKGEVILQEGEVCTHVYFIIKGLARSVYAMKTEDGKIKEVSTWFYAEGDFFYMANSYNNQVPSEESIEALEDTWMLLFEKKIVDEITPKVPELYPFIIKQYESWVVRAERHMRSIYEQNKEKRYEYFLTTFGSLSNRLRQQDIATFLRISMYDFSRLRSKMAKTKE